MGELRCPAGHSGPFRYVEAIEVWRNVDSVDGSVVTVHGLWRTGEGYNDGIEGSECFECHADVGGADCGERIPLAGDIRLVWT